MSCKTYEWTPEKRAEVERALRTSRTRLEAAQKLGKGIGAVDHACGVFGFKAGDLLGRGEDVVIERPAADGLTTEELVADRIRRFERKRSHEESRRLVPVILKSNEPIGILHFGDPHLDDDGTDIATLQAHDRLVRDTPGLYGANVGDTTNNWVGRLAHLWGQQSTTQAESWQLAEWFVHEVRDWLYMVGGNHDLWSGAGDPMKWIAAQAGAYYQQTEVRAALRFPNKREVRINCRHDFAGHSQWNPAHGPMKALFLGVRDHLAIAGHKHISAHSVLVDPDTRIVMHAILTASYKRFDRYALEKGLRDQSISPCCLTVIDPRLPDTHPDLIKLFWCPHEGADYLTWRRRKEAA